MSDIMFFGVLGMPYEMAMDSELSRRQFYGRVQEAVQRVKDAERRAEEAEKERDALRKDAERYRWLRKGLPYRVEAEIGKAIYLIAPRAEKGYPLALDASVDCAVAQEGGK